MQRVLKWLGLVVLAFLPLQWFVLGNTPIGLMRLHQAVMIGATLVLLFSWRLRVYRPVLDVAAPFVVLNVLLLVSWSAVSLYNGQAPRSPFQVSVYLVVMVVMGTYFYQSLSGRIVGATDALRWSATAAGVVLVIALAMSMLKNGVNPVATLQATIKQANPEILQKELFRSSFVGYGYDTSTVRGNIRHEVFGGILLAMYVSAVCEAFPGTTPDRLGRVIRRLGFALCTLLLMTSMSRAVLVAAMAWPVLSLVRSIRRKTLTRRHLAVITGSAVVVGGFMASGLGLVVYNRFTSDTSSYQGRSGLYSNAFAQVPTSFWTGGYNTANESSHNFIIDSLLRGGIVVSFFALSIVLVLFFTWFVMIAKLPREPDWMLAVTAAMALPLDRMLTAGGGLIPPVSWLTLAFIAGAMTLRRQQIRELSRTLPAQPEPELNPPEPVPISVA